MQSELVETVARREVPDRPYFPYLSAVETGVVDPSELVPRKLDDPLGVMLANGRFPKDQAGLIVLGDELYVCDHASVVDSGLDRLFLGPSSKDDISDEGEIRDSGLIVLTNLDELVRIIGAAINSAHNPWQGAGNHLGGIAVKLFGIEARYCEPLDVDREGILELKK